MSLIPNAITLTLAFNAESLAAVNNLAAAIASANGGAAPAAPGKSTASTKVADEPKVTIYWMNNTDGTFGVVESQSAFDALKEADDDVVKNTKAGHDKKVKAAETAAAAAAKKAGAKPKATTTDDEDDVPSEADMLAAFGAFLPADLDEDEKESRRAFVAPMVKRFGAKKASAIPAEHRKLALNLLARHIAGQDIDPETDDYEEFDGEEDGGLV